MIAIKFIGKEAWTDNLYQSGLHWQPKQTREVNSLLGQKLLQHIDLFTEGNKKAVSKQDDTAELSKEAEQQQRDEIDKLNNTLDTFQSVERMERDELILFAQQNFNFKLDRRASVENMRNQVKTMIDQFGLP